MRLKVNLGNHRKTGQTSVGTDPIPVTQVTASTAATTTYTTTTAVDSTAWTLSDVTVGDVATTSGGYIGKITAIDDANDTITVEEWVSPRHERGGNTKPADGTQVRIHRISLVMSISITAAETNSGVIYIGYDGTARVTDYPLQPGESVGLGDPHYVDVTQLYARSASGTETLYWILGSPSGAGNYAPGVSGTGLTTLTWSTFTDGDTTPSVASYQAFHTANTAATTITNFDDATARELIIDFQDANTTIQHNSNIKLAGGIDFTGAQYDTMKLVYNGTEWQEISRSLNS